MQLWGCEKGPRVKRLLFHFAGSVPCCFGGIFVQVFCFASERFGSDGIPPPRAKGDYPGSENKGDDLQV
jgi:hypothetical protein